MYGFEFGVHSQRVGAGPGRALRCSGAARFWSLLQEDLQVRQCPSESTRPSKLKLDLLSNATAKMAKSSNPFALLSNDDDDEVRDGPVVESKAKGGKKGAEPAAAPAPKRTPVGAAPTNLFDAERPSESKLHSPTGPCRLADLGCSGARNKPSLPPCRLWQAV